MDLRHLRYLVAIADATTFTAAAARLRVAQPALTRQIHDLESELGTELFVSGARRATLTPAGEAAVQVSRFIVDEVERSVERARLAQRGLVGKCYIAVSRVPRAMGVLGHLLDRMREKYPGIECVVAEAEFEALWNGISDVTYDIGIGIAPPPRYPALSVETHTRHTFSCAILNKDHPLASRESISIDELRGETPIGIDPELHEAMPLFEAELRRRNFSPPIRSVPGSDAILALIAANRGFTITPQVSPSIVPGFLRGVPVTDFSFSGRFCRIWRRADTRPVTRTVLAMLRRLVAEERRDEADVWTTAELPVPRQDGVPARLELRHLRYFLAAAGSGSIGRAAEQLGVSQPALSRQLRDLEFDIDAALFEREARGVELTPVGETFRDDVREVIAAADGLHMAVRSAARGAAGQVTVALVPVPRVIAMLGRAIFECETHYAPMQVTPIELATAKQLEALSNSKIDVGIAHIINKPALMGDFRVTTLVNDRMNRALVAAEHPLASREEISIHELDDEPFLFLSREVNPWFYDDLLDTLAATNVRPNVIGHNAIETTWALAAQGHGWNLASETLGAAPPPGLIALHLSDFDIQFRIVLMHRHDEARPSVLSLIDAIERSARADSSGVPVPPLAHTYRKSTEDITKS